MWKSETMSVPESLLISLLGITVVFMVLVVLDLAVMVISKIVRLLTGGAAAQTKAAPAKAAVSAEGDSELLAILASAISDDLGITPDQLRIKSIRQI